MARDLMLLSTQRELWRSQFALPADLVRDRRSSTRNEAWRFRLPDNEESANVAPHNRRDRHASLIKRRQR